MNEQPHVDPQIWFAERRVLFEPPHFVRAKAPLKAESTKWIIERLRGRYCLVDVTFDNMIDDQIFSDSGFRGVVPSFEQPHEATFYELTWS